MVDVASVFGIGFLIVSLLMTAALTYLGFAEGEFTGEPADSGDESAPGT